MKPDKEKIDRIWNEAIEYLTTDGWSTHDIDKAIADRIYSRWIHETDAIWCKSGYRDREPLHDALEETFKQHYGEEAGSARMVVFSLLLECRARREGQVRRGRPEA